MSRVIAPVAGLPEALIAVGERANPRRSFLLVSTVLGKHIPLEAARCRLSGAALGLAVAGDARAARALATLESGDAVAAGALLDEIAADPPLALRESTVVGFAETATGLAHQVAETLDSAWLQDTTRHPDAAADGLAFDEAHSHAREQWLRPLPDEASGPLVLVDDELSTGATVARLIGLLHAARPRERYIIACLLDARPGPGPLEELAERLGVPVDVVSLARTGALDLPAAGWSGGELPRSRAAAATGDVRAVEADGPVRRERHGLDRAGRQALRDVAAELAARCGALPPGSLVLGCGEHMALAQLAALAAGPETLVSSTTRSPALVRAGGGYPLADGLAFAHPEAPEVPGFVYNVHAAQRPRIVVHFAEPAHRDAADGLLRELTAAGAADVTTVTLT